jgi:hypothetical protein
MGNTAKHKQLIEDRFFGALNLTMLGSMRADEPLQHQPLLLSDQQRSSR